MGIRQLLYIMLSFPGTYILSGRIKMILPCDGNWCEIHLFFVNIHFLQQCAGNSCEIHWHYVNIRFLPICAGNSKWFSPTEYTYPESWALYIEVAPFSTVMGMLYRAQLSGYVYSVGENQIYSHLCWELMWNSLKVCEYTLFTNMCWEFKLNSSTGCEFRLFTNMCWEFKMILPDRIYVPGKLGPYI